MSKAKEILENLDPKSALLQRLDSIVGAIDQAHNDLWHLNREIPDDLDAIYNELVSEQEQLEDLVSKMEETRKKFMAIVSLGAVFGGNNE